jgi:hypothetical protein
MSGLIVQKTEGVAFFLKDPYVFCNAQHLKDILMDLFHIGKTKLPLIFNGLLDDTDENGGPDAVYILHIRKSLQQVF